MSSISPKSNSGKARPQAEEAGPRTWPPVGCGHLICEMDAKDLDVVELALIMAFLAPLG
jgi:hypothetical protein